MKKICILILAIVLLLSACSRANKNIETESNNDEIEASAPADSDNDPGENDNSPVGEEPVPSEEDNLFTNEYSPILISVKDDDGRFSKGYILGGSKNGKWYDLDSFEITGEYTKPEDFADVPVTDNEVELDLVKGGETYKLYDENGLITLSEGDKPELYISPMSERKSLTVDLDPIEADGSFTIGISGGWFAAPEIQSVLSEETPLHLDIDNDGEDETISLVNNGLQMDAFGNEVEELAINIIDGDNIIFVCNILYNEIETMEYKVLPLDLDGNGNFEIAVVEYGIKTTVRIFDVEEDIADLVLISHIGE